MGFWYHLWVRKQQPSHTVEQLLLPSRYHKIVCKLANTIPIARYMFVGVPRVDDILGQVSTLLLWILL